jgi:hypothetical protein
MRAGRQAEEPRENGVEGRAAGGRSGPSPHGPDLRRREGRHPHRATPVGAVGAPGRHPRVQINDADPTW